MLALSTALLFLSSCMSFQSKAAAKSQAGHPYSGISLDAWTIKCLPQVPSIAKEKDGTSYLITIPGSIVLAAFFVLDMPFSLVADTLFLPFDLATTPSHDRIGPIATPCPSGKSNSAFESGPPSAAAQRERYGSWEVVHG